MVTICTTCSHIKNYKFCPHIAFMYSIWFIKQIPNISFKIINQVFMTEKDCFLYEILTEILYII